MLDYSNEGSRQTVPKASASVERKTIGGLCDSPMRILGAYQDCLKIVHRGYTSMTYTQSMIVSLRSVYKSHRGIEVKSNRVHEAQD